MLVFLFNDFTDLAALNNHRNLSVMMVNFIYYPLCLLLNIADICGESNDHVVFLDELCEVADIFSSLELVSSNHHYLYARLL